MIKYVIRNLFKQQSNIFTRVVTLALGLAVGLFLLCYNTYELSYDRFQSYGERIFRVVIDYKLNGEEESVRSSHSFGPMASTLKNDFPEVEVATCIRKVGKEEYQYQENYFEGNTLYADTAFFHLFSFPVTGIQPSEGLLVPNQLYLSRSFAIVLFGQQEAIGKIVESEGKEWVVAGIFEDVPNKTHLPFKVVKSLNGLNVYKGWGAGDIFYTYIRLQEGCEKENFKGQGEEWLLKYTDSDVKCSLKLLPLREIYSSNNNSILIAWILSILTLIVILITVVNYILLSVSTLEAKVHLVAIHKINGAAGKDIFRMFMCETAYLLLVALGIAMLMLLFLSSWLEVHLGISLREMLVWQSLVVVGGVTISLFLLAGIVPARIFACLPVMQLGRQLNRGTMHWKPFLLGGQFMITVFLLVFLFVLNGQYHLLLHYDIGYSSENMYYTTVKNATGMNNAVRLKEELLRLSYVKGVTLSEGVPYDGLPGIMVVAESQQERYSARCMPVDKDFFEVMKIPLLRKYEEFESKNGVVVNEAFIKMMEWTSSDIRSFIAERGKMNICAVCRNFQVCGLNSGEMPLVMPLITKGIPYYGGETYILIQIDQPFSERLKDIQQFMSKTIPGQHLDLFNYNDEMVLQFSNVLLMKNIISLLFGIIVLITLLGVIGYVGDEISRRTREIALRKVNGATVTEIIEMLGFKVVRIALIAAIPALLGAYWCGKLMLELFVIKYSMTWWIFGGGVVITIGVVSAIVAICSYRAAVMNPVEALKIND